MRIFVPLLICASVVLPAAAGKGSDTERKELEAWAHSLDKQAVHRAVLDHERDPLGDDAKKIRPVLVVHFEPLDYVVCLDQLGPLLDSRNKVSDAIFWQVVFGSGDFVEQHADQATDKFAYMLAGLESGLRAYENILARKPKSRVELLDALLKLRNDGHLMDFVKEKPCDKK
jgi:hypothetical protein